MKKTILKQIEKLHAEERHAEIISFLEKTNEVHDYELTCLLARAYCNMPVMANNDNDYINKGLSLLLSVKDMGENDPLWHYRTGFAYFYADKEEEALIHFKKAVELIPKTKESAVKWRDFNIGYFIGECEDILKAKKIKDKFGTGKKASTEDTLNFILFNLLHRSLPQEDFVTDNSIYIPEWMLVIRPLIIDFDNEKIEIEWNITCPVFDNSIKELTFGAGENLYEAVFIAVGTFTASLLQTVKNYVVGCLEQQHIPIPDRTDIQIVIDLQLILCYFFDCGYDFIEFHILYVFQKRNRLRLNIFKVLAGSQRLGPSHISPGKSYTTLRLVIGNLQLLHQIFFYLTIFYRLHMKRDATA